MPRQNRNEKISISDSGKSYILIFRWKTWKQNKVTKIKLLAFGAKKQTDFYCFIENIIHCFWSCQCCKCVCLDAFGIHFQHWQIFSLFV